MLAQIAAGQPVDFSVKRRWVPLGVGGRHCVGIGLDSSQGIYWGGSIWDLHVELGVYALGAKIGSMRDVCSTVRSCIT